MRLKDIARPLFILLAISAIACSSSPAPDTGDAGKGGSGGTAVVPCEYPDGTSFAELTAPAMEPFGEAAVAVAPSEVAVAYTQWNESRHVSVFLQRFTPEGATVGSPILLGGYDITAGQLAIGDFYGNLTMAVGAGRFMTCWGEAYQVGCASVAVGSGDVSTSTIKSSSDSSFAYNPHVTFGAAGFRVFYHDSDNESALSLGDDASPSGAPVSVPAFIAAATDSGYAVASKSGEFFRLDADLKSVGAPIQISTDSDAIAALGDSVSVVGASAETRIDTSNKTTTSVLINDTSTHRMAVAPRNGSVGVAWTSFDETLRFRAVSAASEVGPTANIGCAPLWSHPSIAPTPDGFLIATLRPEGAYEIFYQPVYPKIRVSRVAQP